VTNKTRARLWLIAGALVLASCSGEGGYTGGSSSRSYYAVTGSIGNLIGSGLVLENNGVSAQQIAASAAAYSFPASNSATGYAIGSPYAITVATQPTNPSQTCTVADGTGTITGDVTVNIACVTNPALSVTVSGLVGTGLTLVNGKNSLAVAPVAVGNATDTFSSPVAAGAQYDVIVSAQPSNPSQTCAVDSPTGTAIGNLALNVNVVCATNSFAVNGTVLGLVGAGLLVQLNGNTAISPSASTLAFGSLPSGANYTVTVVGQPLSPSQICTPSPASGVVGATAVAVAISCTVTSFPVTATLTGLAGAGLSVQFDGGAAMAVPAPASSVVLGNQKSGAAYSVAVVSQPQNLWQTCTPTPPSGTVENSPVVLSITCVTNPYNVNATITGLQGAGLTLQLNGGSFVSASGSPTTVGSLPSGSSYAVTIRQQPANPNQNCVVVNGSGSGTIAGGNVNVSINCETVSTLAFALVNTAPVSIAQFTLTQISPTSMSIGVANAAYQSVPNATSLVTVPDVTFYNSNQTVYTQTCTFAWYPSGLYDCNGVSYPSTGSVADMQYDAASQYLYVDTNDQTTGTSSLIAYGLFNGGLGANGSACSMTGTQAGPITSDPSGDLHYVVSGYYPVNIWACALTSSGLAAVNSTPTLVPQAGNFGTSRAVAHPSLGYLYWTGIVGQYAGPVGTYAAQVWWFSIASTGGLTAISSIGSGQVSCDYGHAHSCPSSTTPLLIDPTGKFLYTAVPALNSTGFISSYAIDQSSGALTPTTAPHPTGNPGNRAVATAVVDPSATFVYFLMVDAAGVSNQIVAYRIDPSSGNLSVAGTQSVGLSTSMVLDSGGNFVYALDSNSSITSSTLYVFGINPYPDQANYGPLQPVTVNGTPNGTYSMVSGATSLAVSP
jgi:hypothetical protein